MNNICFIRGMYHLRISAKTKLPFFHCLATPVSMQDEVGRLASMASDGTIVRHYLEPSIKAPRTFSTTQDDDSTWLECLMRICDVGTAFPVLGSPPSAKLCERLWGHISKCGH